MKKYICRYCGTIFNERQAYKEKGCCPHCQDDIVELEDESELQKNIKVFGVEETWEAIEGYSDPFTRSAMRRSFFKTLERFGKSWR